MPTAPAIPNASTLLLSRVPPHGVSSHGRLDDAPPKSLTSDEVYALTAYLLALNKVIGDNDTMNATTLPQVRMPNRDGFILRFPNRI